MRRDGRAGKDGRQQKPRPVTGEWLFRAAAHYLERYASSQENLRRVLQRKIDRRIAAEEEGPDEAAAAAHAGLVEETVARFVELKLLDDHSFAESKLRTLRRGGASIRQASAKLGQKGVDRETIAAVVAGDETGDRAAAHRYASRRRLGPHRTKDRDERRERDIAAMMRAGFSYGDAKAAVDGACDGEE